MILLWDMPFISFYILFLDVTLSLDMALASAI